MKDLETKYLYPKNPKKIKYPIYPYIQQLSDYKVFKSNYISGHRENRLKTKLESLYKNSEILLTNSGTSALKMGLVCLDIKPNDEVMFTNFNCPNIIDAVLSIGATPVFVDIEEDFSLSFEDIKKKVNDKTKAIISTHVYGLKENLKIYDWAKKKNIYIVDDGAQAMFTLQNNKFVGGHGDIGILSFGFTKPLSSIGGGALIVNNKSLIGRLPKVPIETEEEVYIDYKNYFRSWALFKLNTFYIPSKLNKVWYRLFKMPKTYLSKTEAFPRNIRLIEIKRMNRLREELILKQFYRYKKIWDYNIANYQEMNNNLKCLVRYGIKLIHLDKGESPNYYTLIFPNEHQRYECSEYLAGKGIQTCWNYIPLDEIPIYSKYKSNTKNANTVWGRVLSVPFKYPLVSKDIQYISLQLKNYIEKSTLLNI
ncbi:aminotransferase class V-fold PLP-dependent enzyme [Virgibacillus dokdonensis]|uniref:dTDP-4-amino-4,6-dideoxygalactose transaminase n=1 Tax=Virgibacillus dokdonensis TaxID=302167 RepID=A0A2K9IYP8_9BACI|nr:aminotransferase class V-fold PLP-dependent enzyme [Virgibacillus dokdonensis]AUJ24839.1 dTDP-4-amino-4,6-dideoxygalactose transaminase [Virgibacillus dokdonensis]